MKFKEAPKELPCLDCCGMLSDFERHFKPLKKSDSKQWREIRFFVEHGFKFQDIPIERDSVASVPYPETLEKAREFAIKYADHAILSEQVSF